MHVACKIPSCILNDDSGIHIMKNRAIRERWVKVKPVLHDEFELRTDLKKEEIRTPRMAKGQKVS